MATYPSFNVFPDESEREPIKNLVVDEWPNAGARGQDFTSAVRYRFKVVHAALNNTDRDTLEAFFEANIATPFDFVDQFGSTTTTRTNCIFLPGGLQIRRLDKLLSKAVVLFRMR